MLHQFTAFSAPMVLLLALGRFGPSLAGENNSTASDDTTIDATATSVELPVPAESTNEPNPPNATVGAADTAVNGPNSPITGADDPAGGAIPSGGQTTDPNLPPLPDDATPADTRPGPAGPADGATLPTGKKPAPLPVVVLENRNAQELLIRVIDLRTRQVSRHVLQPGEAIKQPVVPEPPQTIEIVHTYFDPFVGPVHEVRTRTLPPRPRYLVEVAVAKTLYRYVDRRAKRGPLPDFEQRTWEPAGRFLLPVGEALKDGMSIDVLAAAIAAPDGRVAPGRLPHCHGGFCR